MLIRQAFFNCNPLFHVVIIAFRLLGISPVSVLAIAAIVTFSLVHYHSLHPGQRVQNFLTACKIAFILLFVVAGFGLGQGDPSRPDLPEPDLLRPCRTFGYPFTPLLFIAGNLWVVVFYDLQQTACRGSRSADDRYRRCTLFSAEQTVGRFSGLVLPGW